MISFLKGVMWGIIIVGMIITSLRGLWWFFPASILIVGVVGCVAKSIVHGVEPQ